MDEKNLFLFGFLWYLFFMDGKELMLFLFVEVDSGAARIDLLTLEVTLCIVVVRLLG
jgi:hypothetical protein